MSAYLANLLSKETTSFKKFIDDIEFTTGHDKKDLKLASNIKIVANHKIKSLGLNPDDTTPSELYYALNNLLELHDRFIVKKIDTSYGAPLSVALNNIVTIFNEPVNSQSVFCIRSNVIRKILTKNQPLKTVALLGHRSFNSMLKLEDPKTVLSLAYYIESEEWKMIYIDLLKKLSINDFEYRNAKLIILDNLKFKKISKIITDINGYNIISLENMGQILIVPQDSKIRVGFSIFTFAYIINQLKQMVRFSIFIQNQQFNSNFGETISLLLKNTDSINFYISKYNFLWDSATNFTKSMKVLSDEEKEDILFQQSLHNVNQLDQILMQLEPALHFWLDNDNLGYFDNDTVVSLNLLDVGYNCCNQLSLKDSSSIFMKIAINKSLINKYLESEICNDQVLKQLSSGLQSNDFMQIFKNRIVYS